jgi:hypothetical protein
MNYNVKNLDTLDFYLFVMNMSVTKISNNHKWMLQNTMLLLKTLTCIA